MNEMKVSAKVCGYSNDAVWKAHEKLTLQIELEWWRQGDSNS